MIMNLAQIITSSIQDCNGNHGNYGNPACKPAPIRALHKTEQFPKANNETGTTGTAPEETGTAKQEKTSECRMVICTVPEIPEVPVINMHGGKTIAPPDCCQARKTGGRICGALLREGINGHLSCDDPACQVPATPHGLMRRTGHKTLISA